MKLNRQDKFRIRLKLIKFQKFLSQWKLLILGESCFIMITLALIRYLRSKTNDCFLTFSIYFEKFQWNFVGLMDCVWKKYECPRLKKLLLLLSSANNQELHYILILIRLQLNQWINKVDRNLYIFWLLRIFKIYRENKSVFISILMIVYIIFSVPQTANFSMFLVNSKLWKNQFDFYSVIEIALNMFAGWWLNHNLV